MVLIKLVLTMFHWLKKYWLRVSAWLEKHEVIAGLIVTFAGVFLAVYVNECIKRRALNKATEERMHLAMLEMMYNKRTSANVAKTYSKKIDPNSLITRFDRCSCNALALALRDANLCSLVPPYKISMLMGYLLEVEKFNRTVDAHLGLWESQGYRTTVQEKQFRKKVRSDAERHVIRIFYLQQELADYFDPNDFDVQKLKAFRDRVKCVEQNLQIKRSASP